MRKESIVPMDPIAFLTEQVMALQGEIQELKNIVANNGAAPVQNERIYLLEINDDYTIHKSLEEAQKIQNEISRTVKSFIRSFKDEDEKNQYISRRVKKKREQDYFLAYYVEKGRITGSISDPKVLRYSVDNFPGASYTTFRSPKEMSFYHKGIKDASIRLRENFIDSKRVLEKSGVDTFFYIDGSCDWDKNLFSSGFVMEHLGEYKKTQSFTFDIHKSGPKRASKAAELQSAMMAVIEAKRRGLERFSIVFDCMAVVEEYLTESDTCVISKNYHNWMKRETAGMNIEFLKAKSHIGIEGNELVDDLVKLAIDSPRKIIK